MVLDSQFLREADPHVPSAPLEQRTSDARHRVSASTVLARRCDRHPTQPARRLLVLVTTPALALGSITVASAFVLGAFDHHVSAVVATCRPLAQVDLASFKVSVLNGSGIPGQARLAAGQLTKAGFRVDRVTTASDGRWTDAPAVISYGAQGREPALRLAAHLPGAVQVPDSGPRP